MSKGLKASRTPWLLVVLLLVGGLAGSALGDSVGVFSPFLSNASRVSLGPVTVNLGFFHFTFGLGLAVGPLTVLGFIAGYLVYRRL